jgi:ABC-type enterobactin transport system permease subunit
MICQLCSLRNSFICVAFSDVPGFSAGSYTGIFVFRLLRDILKLSSDQLQAIVGGLAISPSQIPVNCAGLHIIHVIEDKLCVFGILGCRHAKRCLIGSHV